MSDNINGEIRELQEKIDKLTKEKNILESLTPEQQLATIIHDRLCHSNHIDGCSWDYETWDYDFHSTRGRYLEKAKKVLKLVDLEIAIKIFEIL